MSDQGSASFIPQSGMTASHFAVFQQVAQQEQVIAVVRNTNTASAILIERGCPAKPLTIKFHTSESTGVVTAANPAEISTAYQQGYFVVDADRVARRVVMQNGRQVKQVLKLQSPFWRVEPGQLIDPTLKKPLVGDYDLMGVIDPRSPGRNIALVAVDGKNVTDVNSPIVQRFATQVNARLDKPRVLHGAQDQFAGFRGGATVFLPNGRAMLLPDEAAVKEFYELIGRQTIKGQYLRPVPTTIPTVSGRSFVQRGARGVVRNQAAMAVLGQSLGMAIQRLGDFGIQRRVRQELETTHAEQIMNTLAGGNGVLVIIRLQEWAQPDFNGMRARNLLGVHIEGGPNQESALREWRKPKLIKDAPAGWRAFEQYVWIDPQR